MLKVVSYRKVKPKDLKVGGYKEQMEYENVTNPPIITSTDPEKTILDMIVPPELHLLIGSVDKLMKEMENNIFYAPKDGNSEEEKAQSVPMDQETFKALTKEEKKVTKARLAAERKAAKVSATAAKKAAKKALRKRKKAARAAGRKFMDDYLKQSNVSLVRKSYQGSHSLEGNQSRSFLKKIDLLEAHLLKQPSKVADNGLPYIKAFRALDKVVNACFGVDLNPEYKNFIEEFREAYLDLGVSISPKVHIIFQHVVEVLNKENSTRERKVGLGHFSEQSFESAHSDINVLWQRVKVPENHPEFPARLKHFCSSYFASHI